MVKIFSSSYYVLMRRSTDVQTYTHEAQRTALVI